VYFDKTQTKVIVASTDDVLWIDIANRVELDIDNEYQIRDIKSILFIEDKFYVLANKYQRKLGYFLLEIDVNLDQSLKKGKGVRYVIKWENKLEIDDASLQYIKKEKEFGRNIVVSYKSIHINSINQAHFTPTRSSSLTLKQPELNSCLTATNSGRIQCLASLIPTTTTLSSSTKKVPVSSHWARIKRELSITQTEHSGWSIHYHRAIT
jgi:hypothetical protein